MVGPEGTRPSPNIWHHTETYEVENRAFDPDRLVEQAIASVAPWDGLDVLDRAGVEVPTTWAGLRETAKRLTQGKQYGLALSAGGAEDGCRCP